jgi:hypothetical protein
MNKQDLLNKLAAKQAAAQEVEITNVDVKAPLKSFVIHWSEAGDKYNDQPVETWEGANRMMLNLWTMVKTKYGLDSGYYKTKVTITWADGSEITDRIDLGTGGDFNPDECTIQDFIKGQTGVMYASNLQKGDRTRLSWLDEIQEPQTEPAPETEPQDIPPMLCKLLGIVETIEEANDNSETALLKASEQVERCELYITYLQSILPILKAKTNAMIEAKHAKKVFISYQNAKFN